MDTVDLNLWADLRHESQILKNRGGDIFQRRSYGLAREVIDKVGKATPACGSQFVQIEDLGRCHVGGKRVKRRDVAETTEDLDGVAVGNNPEPVDNERRTHVIGAPGKMAPLNIVT